MKDRVMYGMLIGITMLEQFRPYFRKHISNVLDHHEYFLLSAMMILSIITMYVVYLVWISGTTTLGTMTTNLSELSCTEVFFIFVLSSLTVITGLLIFELDKNHNTPLLNSVLLKSISTISVICVGVVIFEERYKIHQVIGLGLIVLGIYLATQKNLYNKL